MAKQAKKKIGFFRGILLNVEYLRHQALLRLCYRSGLCSEGIDAMIDENFNFNVAMLKAKSRKEKKALKIKHEKNIEAIKKQFRFRPEYDNDRFVQVIDPEKNNSGEQLTIVDSRTNESFTIDLPADEEQEEQKRRDAEMDELMEALSSKFNPGDLVGSYEREYKSSIGAEMEDGKNEPTFGSTDGEGK